MLLAIVLALSSLGFGPPVVSDGGHPPLRFYPEQIKAQHLLAQAPPVQAASALLVDLDAQQTLYSLRPHQTLAPASTVKMMTALLVLQRAQLTDTVKVSANAAGTGGSTMGLQAGEKLSVRDLLYGLMLPSGNDAAVALAEHVAGSEQEFVKLMNSQAATLGLTDTHYTTANGLDDPEQHSSVTDMVKLAQTALANATFARIAATRTARVAGRDLTNTNELLGSYPGADGVKTGTTPDAGECLVASVTVQGHHRLLALLGSQDRYADARALFDYAAAGWSWRPLAVPDNALAWQPGLDGKSYRLRAEGNADLFLPSWEWPLVQPVRVLDAAVPLTVTHPVGLLQLTLAGQVLKSTPLWISP